MMTQYEIATSMIHPEQVSLPQGNEPLVAPIHQSVKYIPRNMAHMRQILADRKAGFIYSRIANPTVRELELLLAKIQGRDDAICLASGIGAIATAVIGLVSTGDHVVVFRESYKPTRYLLNQVLGKLGVRITTLGMDDAEGLNKILSNDVPKLVLVESPTNPVVRIPCLQTLVGQCHRVGALVLLDNTFAGFHHHGGIPIDVYVHSLTKHACGHSDAMGGVIIGRSELIDKIWPTSITLGATLDPHAAWLIMRGMKTYDLRTTAASANAAKIADWLKSRRGVSNVSYPGHADHPDFQVWKMQMGPDGGSIVAFDIDGSTETMDRFIDGLKIFALTPSVGCVESLVAPCMLLFGDDLTADEARSAGIRPTTVRLAIGVEAVKDLIGDLDQALNAVGFL